MRITGFHVDGFGLLAGQAVDGIGAGTTVVLGPNEAGKSTLHAFLVRTLFGHPRVNDAEARNRHEPLRGGRHGGVVHCVDERGAWEVHRYTEGSPRLRVVDPDGTEGTGNDAVLPLLGRTVDEARYEQVFAIDLDDLAGVGSLGGGSLDDLLFDAATVGTGRSLRAARDEAVERRDALWTPTSTKRPLASAIARRSEARSALAAARDAARANLDVRRRLDAAAGRVEQLSGQQQEQASRIALLERVRDAWPSFSRARDLAGQLEQEPEVAVDGDTAGAVRAAAEEAAIAADRRVELEQDHQQLVATIDRIGIDPDAVDVADSVEALADRLSAHEVAVEQHVAAEQARDDAGRRVAAAMAELGDGWDEARVRRVATDTPTRHRLQAAGDDLLEAGRRADAITERAAEAARQSARRQEQLAQRRAAVPDAPDDAKVAAAEAALAVLRAGVPTLERAELLGMPTAPADEVGWQPPPWLSGLLLGLALVLAAGTAVGPVPGGIGVVGTAVLAGGGAFLLGRMRATAMPTAGARPEGARDERAIGDVVAQVAAAARDVGLSPRPAMAEVERVATRVAAARSELREAAEAQRLVTAAEAEAEDAAAAANDLAATADARAAMLAEARTSWTAVCQEAGLDPDEDVRVALSRHDRATAARRALDELAAAEQDVAARRAQVEAFRADVVAVLGRLGEEADPRVAVRRLPALRERIRSACTAQRERDQQEARLAVLEEELAVARERDAAARAELNEALAAAGVQDITTFETRLEQADRRAELATAREAAEREVDRLLGTGPRGTEGRALLQGADPTAWEEELAAARRTAAMLTDERDDALAERTELEAELRRLGGDDAVPRAQQELAAAELEVAELAERWAVADTASRLLEETVARFEREQQPRVLTRASELLERATGGQWAQVRRLDGQVVVARSEGGDPVPAEVLSRGTREQLWLCLRLALAEDLSRDRPLPLLVDDLLGTSDPERSLHVARVLAEVARRQQVWLFTCHPRTADLVTSTDPEAGVLRLRRGGKVAGLSRREVAPDEEFVLQLDV